MLCMVIDNWMVGVSIRHKKMSSISKVMWMDCLMNFLHPSEFMWFYVIFLHLFWFILIFCGCSDLFGLLWFVWIYLDLFGFFLIFCDLLWFFLIVGDLFWFLLIWVNTLCIVTYFCHTPHHWNVLKNGEKWCLYGVKHMMSLVCHCYFT